ncbi:hypothetical protein NM208_g16757 [Fusarium decemcellulare]|uniref:Uncharacterized protein n=1 Tax=Fusarium decemcellulare TaxID=57161 RepID=A0ACC1RB67_9HYPO|nr:hypothetical protein NM208_g16757 [Fusarium decemcellulare]
MGSGRHPYVSCVDIGRMIARALLEPDKFAGQIINLAGQRATVDELQDALARGAGTRSWRIWVPRWLVLLLSPYHYRQMFEWFGSVTQPDDPEECRQILGSVLNIEDWSKKQKAAADAELARKNK